MKLVQAWYGHSKTVWLLFPFSMLFYGLSALRRLLYKWQVLKTYRVQANVIVVGNISVGGNGKTPVVIALVEHFLDKGIKVGVLSRGYGGACKTFPHTLVENDSAQWVGDEPKLIHKRTNAVVVIDPDRARGANTLSTQHNCEVIVCDDGLQHYALARDMEIVVMDERKLGNGYLLPMGPLREGAWRLSHVDMVVHNKRSLTTPSVNSELAQYEMSLQGTALVNVKTGLKLSISDFISLHRAVSALAGIGDPQRFFDYLTSLSLSVENKIALPDHHQIELRHIPVGTVVMTEKDAVKVAQFAHEDCWYLPVNAQLSEEFYTHIDKRLAHINSTRIG